MNRTVEKKIKEAVNSIYDLVLFCGGNFSYSESEEKAGIRAIIEKVLSNPPQGSSNNKPPRLISLKTWPDFFDDVLRGEKTFELRKNDKIFRKGDIIILREWCPSEREYTGRDIIIKINYIIYEGFGLKKGYCCFCFDKA